MRDRKYLPADDAPTRATVRPRSKNARMKNYGLTWTDPDGTPRAAAVSYDKASADDRQARLVAAKCRDVEIVETKPGELAQPQG
jgi:hypothetical protein